MEQQIIQYLWDTFIAEGMLVIAAVFVVGQMIKQMPLFAKVPNQYISLIGVVLGAVVAVTVPDVYPGEELTTAAIKGGSLGLMTTGLYEVLKIFFPKLSAKLEERTSDLDEALAGIVDTVDQIGGAGKEDVEDSKTNDRSIEELAEELYAAIEKTSPELVENVKSAINDQLSKSLNEGK